MSQSTNMGQTGCKEFSKWYRKIACCTFLLFGLLQAEIAQAQDSLYDVTLQGKNAEIKLSDFRGKLLYIDFWASWCAPCLKSFPWMNEMQKKYSRQGLQIVAINVDKDGNAANEFLAKTQPVFPIGFDPEGELASEFNVVGMPNSFLFDRAGNLVSSHVGFRKKDREKFEQAFIDALSQ